MRPDLGFVKMAQVGGLFGEIISARSTAAIPKVVLGEPSADAFQSLFKLEDIDHWEDLASAIEYEGFDPAYISALLLARAKALGKSEERFREDMRAIIVLVNTRGTNVAKIAEHTDKAAWAVFNKIYNEYDMKPTPEKRDSVTVGRVVLCFAPMAVRSASVSTRKIGPVEMSELPEGFPPCVRSTAFAGVMTPEVWPVLGVFSIYHALLMTDKIIRADQSRQQMARNTTKAQYAAACNCFFSKSQKLGFLVDLKLIQVYENEGMTNPWRRVNGATGYPKLWARLHPDLHACFEECKKDVEIAYERLKFEGASDGVKEKFVVTLH